MLNKTICMVIPNLIPGNQGGSELQALKLIKKLLDNNINLIIATRKIDSEYEFLKKYGLKDILLISKNKLDIYNITKKINNYNNYLIDYTQCNNDKYYKKEFNIIKKILFMMKVFYDYFSLLYPYRKKIDIIQINILSVDGLVIGLIGKILNKKVIIKDSTMDGIKKLYLCPFKNFFRKFLLKNCYFVAISKSIYQLYYSLLCDKERIKFIPNGIEINTKVSDENRDPDLFLCVGNLYQQPAKGIDILLYAWAKFIKKYNSCKLIIVGDGPVEEFIKFSKKIGIPENNISFVGRQNPENYYKIATYFVLPSRREGLSNALLEAINNRLIVIASNISGNIDLIEDKKSGYLFVSENIENLVEKLEEAYNNFKNNLYILNKAKEKLKYYDINKIYKKYIGLYKSIIKD